MLKKILFFLCIFIQSNMGALENYKKICKISKADFGEYLQHMYLNVCAARQMQDALKELTQTPEWKDKCKIYKDWESFTPFGSNPYLDDKYHSEIFIQHGVIYLPFGRCELPSFDIEGIEERKRFWQQFIKKINAYFFDFVRFKGRTDWKEGERDRFHVPRNPQGEIIPQLTRLDFKDEHIRELWRWMNFHYDNCKKKHS